MRYVLWVLGIAGALVLIGSFAQHSQRKPMSADAWKRAAERGNQIFLEEEKFDSLHPFKGHPASGAMDQLLAEGYQCEFGILDLVRVAKDTKVTLQTYPAPVISCEKRATEASDICLARHVNLVVDWDGPVPPTRDMPARVRSRAIADRGFWCVQPGDRKPR
jgi:hypothetical protein